MDDDERSAVGTDQARGANTTKVIIALIGAIALIVAGFVTGFFQVWAAKITAEAAKITAGPAEVSQTTSTVDPTNGGTRQPVASRTRLRLAQTWLNSPAVSSRNPGLSIATAVVPIGAEMP
jgi:hypothetical protein